jgi:DNA-binding XRE family transcriptional regulator
LFTDDYANWENGKATPSAVLYKRVIEFLGYYPHPTPRSLGPRLLKIRRCLGLTSRQTADLIGVDHETFLKWESGTWRPTIRTRQKVERFIAQHEPELREFRGTQTCHST